MSNSIVEKNIAALRRYLSEFPAFPGRGAPVKLIVCSHDTGEILHTGREAHDASIATGLKLMLIDEYDTGKGFWRIKTCWQTSNRKPPEGIIGDIMKETFKEWNALHGR
jgi:hypothetical protein